MWTRPSTCARSTAPTVGRGCWRGDDPEPLRHQVVEIPDPRVIVTEYRLHALGCPRCAHVTRAGLPEGEPERVRTTGPCAGSGDVGRTVQTEQALGDRPDGPGLGPADEPWSADQDRAAGQRDARLAHRGVARPLAGRRQCPRRRDELAGTAEARLAVAGRHDRVAVFLVRPGRGGVVARDLFGDAFAGVLCTDRWSAYSGIARRALCWAHLLRDFTAMVERHRGQWHAIGSACSPRNPGPLARLAPRRDRPRDADRAHGTAASTLRATARLDRPQRPGRKAAGIARDLLGRPDRLWRFLDDPLVHPTNNLAERLLRYAVIYRKLSFGTDSEAGSRYLERLLSTAATLSLQDRNLFDYLAAGMGAHFAGQAVPSLLPVAQAA
ncbi:MAG: transposase [Nitrospiraceae bacterium]